MKKIIKLNFLFLLILCASQITNLIAQPTSLPLMQIGDLEYQGAFAIPQTGDLENSANSSTGSIAYNPANQSLFITGHNRYGKIAEFSIPELVNTKTDVSALNQATLLQDFRAVLSAAPTGNPQNIDIINGLALVNGKLIVNGEDKYDGGADNTHTTLVVENASNLANSTVNGFYELEGAVHAAGWMSPVPAEWQALLGGSYIAGHAGKQAINRRYSIGASAFAFNPANISGTSGTILTTTLLDFSIDNPLHADYTNYERAFYNMLEINGDASFTGHTVEDADGVVGTNDLYTVLSFVSYGFIVPGTRTYLTLGASGGHNSGIGYKPKQSHGYTCPGPCPYDGEDYYNYYWLWDVNDLLDVKNGVKNSYDIRPYDYGLFETLFRSDENPRPWDLQAITGGTFDADNGMLYLSIHDGASTDRYQRLPAIVAYKINLEYTDVDNDDVCAENDPNDNDECIPNACAGCELLTNTDFDNGITPWGTSGADFESVNGVVEITNIEPSDVPWRVSFVKRDIPIVRGEDYTVKFRARADANRPLNVLVELQGAPYTKYFNTVVNLSPGMQDYTFNFTMTEPTDNAASFMFFMGGNTVNTYIDKASLTTADCDIPPPSGECDCPVVNEPGNTVTVENVSQLVAAVDQANSQNGNMTIKLKPGVYQLNTGLIIRPNTSNLTIVGITGNRDDVFIKGNGALGNVRHIFLVEADNFSVADLTVGEVTTHAIQVQAQQDADDFTAVNVRFVDIFEQMLKVSGGDGSNYSDRGKVLCCAFEFTAGIGYQWYTGGVDCHRSNDWLISNNTFDGIRSPEERLSEHAIHIWVVSEGTIVTGNRIMNCDRGIGFGLSDDVDRGHIGGLIMNNFVHTNRDVGIGLENSPDTKVYNNTVVTDNYPRSIEYRFAGTKNVEIINNLTSGEISDRSSGATGRLATNYTVSDLSIFTNAGNYDYHLVGRPLSIVNKGTPLSAVTADIDCDNRISGAGIDIGADEVTNAATTVCRELLTIEQSITTGLYKAKTIIAPMAAPGNTISTNGEILFEAEENVNLESILISKDSNFEIDIRRCQE